MSETMLLIENKVERERKQKAKEEEATQNVGLT